MVKRLLPFFINIDWLEPLPIPNAYKRKAFRVSISQQLLTAFILNILSLAIPIMMLQVYDRIIPHKSYGTLSLLTLGVMVALGLDATLRILRSWVVGWTAASNEHVANCAALNHLNRSDLSEFEKKSSGEHLQSFSALSRLREFYSGQALTALIDLPFAAIFLILIAYLGGILVVVPVILLAGFFLCARSVGLVLKKALEHRHHSDDRKSSIMVSILAGIHTVKSIGLESFLLRQYERAQKDVTNDSFFVARASGKASTLGATFGQLSLILTAAAGSILVVQGDLSVGGLSACTLLAGRAIQPIQRVLGTWLRLQDLSIAKQQAKSLFMLPVRQELQRVTPLVVGNVELERVSFGYSGHANLLENISLGIKAGESIAITGGKGSGKSTLLQLIAGIITPQSGRVWIDDFDPADFNLSNFKGRIGYLPQHGAIFRGTILENITGFRVDDISVSAAKKAGADLGLDVVVDFLPYGYQTVLTDTNADPVPPGIKQRIALARVLARHPSILLFDDADRALDKEGYNKLFRIMGKLRGKCTMVVVSHDRNLLSFSDKIFHLGVGKLQESERGVQNISHINISQGNSNDSFM